MEHESFEDEQVAKVMNEHFVNIKGTWTGCWDNTNEILFILTMGYNLPIPVDR